MNSGVTLAAFQTLHEQLASALLKKIQSGEATAAELKEAREFLKDNGIDGVRKEGGSLSVLTDLVSFNDSEEIPLRVMG